MPPFVLAEPPRRSFGRSTHAVKDQRFRFLEKHQRASLMMRASEPCWCLAIAKRRGPFLRVVQPVRRSVRR